MASNLANSGLLGALNGTFNLHSSADVRAVLVKSGSFDKDYDYLSDLTLGTNELTVAGYARVACTSETVAKDDTNDWVKFSTADIAFGALTAGETITKMYLYVYNAADSAAQIIACIDVTDTATNGGTITATCPANGWFYIAT